MAMTIREIAEADVPAVTRRLQAEYGGDIGSQQNVATKVWGDPDYAAELNLGAWDGSWLHGVVLGVRRADVGWIKAMTVWPHTVAAELLLARIEAVLWSAGAKQLRFCGSAPSYFLPGVDPRDTTALLFYQSRGFERCGEACNMECRLDQVQFDTGDTETRLTGEGYTFSRLCAGDTDALAAFMRSHFSEGWLNETLGALNHDPPTCQLCWRGTEIVGFAASEVTNPGWFGPMGTAPPHRGRGIGKTLLLRALRDLRDLGHRTAQIGWVGPLGFYSRHCGARVSRQFWMMSKELGA